ncbi:MAG: DUF1934 domain-containing protein [Clostridia bacterium]|nr:DUF1934 domain-containing protein [Clostridia bacterium]
MKGKLTVKSVFDNDEVIEYTTDATVGIHNGTLFISYSEDSESYADTNTKIGVSKDVVSLNRFGQFPASFLFSKGQTQKGKISTLIGELDVDINTQKLNVEFGKGSLRVLLCYQMIIQGGASTCRMDLSCTFGGDR